MDNQDERQKKNGLERKEKNCKPNNLPLVLIVEDNEVDRRLLGNILKKESYRVSIAENGRQAITTVFNAQPDLILLDVLMPVMDGLMVCRQIKKSSVTSDIPIIFITSLDDEKAKIKGLQNGAVDYLIKPVNLTELLAKIRTHVDQYRHMQALKDELSKVQASLQSLPPPPSKDNPPIKENKKNNVMPGKLKRSE